MWRPATAAVLANAWQGHWLALLFLRHDNPRYNARRALASDTATGAAILREPGDKAELERQSATMRAACAKAGIAPFEEP